MFYPLDREAVAAATVVDAAEEEENKEAEEEAAEVGEEEAADYGGGSSSSSGWSWGAWGDPWSGRGRRRYRSGRAKRAGRWFP